MPFDSSCALQNDGLSTARIAIVGGGKMGEAILKGWISSDCGVAAPLAAPNFTVVNPGADRRGHLRREYNVIGIRDVAELTTADIVVLSVKPQVMPDVLSVLKGLPLTQDALFISVAAGLPTSKIEAQLCGTPRVVRVMPNTPLLLGQGATTMCAGTHATQDDLSLVEALFGCIGESFVVDESQMDATGAINGSGPAYVAAMVEALASAGETFGLDRALAERLAAQTVTGTGALMTQAGQSAEKTRVDVCSPNGTTLAALGAMQPEFSDTINKGVAAAIARSKELGA